MNGASNRFLLDSWAVLAMVRKEEPAASRVRELWDMAADGHVRLFISLINLGEVYYISGQLWGSDTAETILHYIKQSAIQLLPVDEDLVLAAARYKMNHRLSYADAFAVATAVPRHLTIVTGDPELFALEPEISIERLRRD